MNIQTNDKIRIKYGEQELIFVGLEEGLKEFNEDNLNKMFGKMSNLTTYNNNLKPNYELFIPFKFWFNNLCICIMYFYINNNIFFSF